MKMMIGSIGEWLFTMFSVSAVIGIIDIFAPEGKIKSYIRYTISIVVMIILISPISGILQAIPNFINTISLISEGSTAGEYTANNDSDTEIEGALSEAEIKLIESGRNTIENHARKLISTEFHISEDNISVFAELETDDVQNIILRKLNIHIAVPDSYINGKKEIPVSKEDIRKYAAEYYGCPVTVETE